MSTQPGNHRAESPVEITSLDKLSVGLSLHSFSGIWDSSYSPLAPGDLDFMSPYFLSPQISAQIQVVLMDFTQIDSSSPKTHKELSCGTVTWLRWSLSPTQYLMGDTGGPSPFFVLSKEMVNYLGGLRIFWNEEVL